MKKILSFMVAWVMLTSSAFAWDYPTATPGVFQSTFNGADITNSFNDIYTNSLEDANDTISPDNIMSTGKTDEYCLSYELTGDTFEWVVCGSGGASTWLDLTDTPSAFTADYWVKVNSAGTALELVTAPAGTGDVVGPASATDNAFPRYDTTAGKLLQNGQTTEDDSGNVTVAGTLTAESLTTTGSDTYHGLTITSNSAATNVGNESYTNVVNVPSWKDSTGTVKAIGLAGDSSNTNMLMYTNSDLGTVDSGSVKTIYVPTNVEWTSGSLTCDGTTITGLVFTVEYSATADGTYTSYGTVSAEGAIDVSLWADVTAGTWVRTRVSTASTGDAVTCWIPLTLTNL